MLVIDASVVVPLVADSGPDGRRFRDRIGGESLCAPDLLLLEVVSVLRRRAREGWLTSEQAELAINSALALPIDSYPAAPFIGRCWELRNNLTTYDASYVSLAEALGCPLLTSDSRLSRAPGLRCTVEVV